MNWISTNKELPETNKYVLGIYGGDNWSDSAANFNVVVVKLVKGISEEERDILKSQDDLRHKEYRWGDIRGNNLVPYAWSGFGISRFFGQDITHWIDIPKFNK